VHNLIDIKPMRATLLAIAGSMDEREASMAFSFLVALGVRLMIAATIRSGSVETPLSNAAQLIAAGQLTSCEALKTQLRPMIPSDQQFREAFERARVSSAKLARYYLRSLELCAEGDAEPWFIPQDDASVINLEHVLPEKTEGGWAQFSEDDVAQYAKRLGNLVLMKARENSELKSKEFAEKVGVYRGSPYVLTSEVAEEQAWSVDAIVRRQRHLADLAVKTWSTS
jgi:hypothetical protein